jgi:hypothetical protein
MKDNILAVIYQLTRKLCVNVTNNYIKLELDKHPTQSTLLAISEILDVWKIPSAAYWISSEQIIYLPTPSITNSLKKFIKNSIIHPN